MKKAVRVAAINQVRALRRPTVPFELLVTHGRETQANGIALQGAFRAIQNQQPLRLVNAQSRDFGPVIGTEPACAGRQERGHAAQQHYPP